MHAAAINGSPQENGSARVLLWRAFKFSAAQMFKAR